MLVTLILLVMTFSYGLVGNVEGDSDAGKIVAGGGGVNLPGDVILGKSQVFFVDPHSRIEVITIFTYIVRPSPIFKTGNTNQKVKTVFANGGTGVWLWGSLTTHFLLLLFLFKYLCNIYFNL